MFKIEEFPKQHVPGSDWIAWLKSPDGFSVKVQISGRATSEKASEIIHQFAGIVNMAYEEDEQDEDSPFSRTNPFGERE